MKNTIIHPLILRPTKKLLFYMALALFLLVGVFLCVLFLAKDEVRPVFAYTWTAFFVLIVLYMLYGYIRLLVIALLKKREEAKLPTAFVKDKPFRSLFTRFGGVVAGFAFVGWNMFKALSGTEMMHWILAEFYWFVAIIRLYMDYIFDRDEGVKKDIAYVIINACLIFLSGVIVSITIFVLYFESVFEKSWLTVFPMALFTVYKVVSSVIALVKAGKTRSVYDQTFANAAFSCALFSLYTLIIAMIILFSESTFYKQFAYAGFAVAAVVFILGVVGMFFASRRLDIARKRVKIADRE